MLRLKISTNADTMQFRLIPYRAILPCASKTGPLRYSNRILQHPMMCSVIQHKNVEGGDAESNIYYNKRIEMVSLYIISIVSGEHNCQKIFMYVNCKFEKTMLYSAPYCPNKMTIMMMLTRITNRSFLHVTLTLKSVLRGSPLSLYSCVFIAF